VVTAEKRETRLQDTPIAITAVTGEALEARSATDVSAVASIAPNVQFQGSAPLSGGSFNATVFIRGVGQNDASVFNDPGVGIYLDGVYLGRTTGSILELADIERVEVLRGPQGTLFGKNAVGGAISIVSKQPTPEFEAALNASVGNFNRRDVSLMVSGPIMGSDTVLGRFSIGKFVKDGYVTRLTDGEDLGDKDVFGAKGQIRWAPSDRLNVDFAADFTRMRQNSAALTLISMAPTGAPFLNTFNATVAPGLPIVAPNGQRSLNPSWVTGNPFTTWASGHNINNLDHWGVSATVNYDVTDALSVRSITAYRKLDSIFGRDGDNTPYDFRHTYDEVKQDQFSQEFQLIGDAVGGRLQYVLGAYYLKETAVDDGVITLAKGVYDPVLRPNLALELWFRQFLDMRTTSYAAFANASFDFTDQLSATVGLRYTKDEKEFYVFEQRYVSGTFLVDPAVLRRLYGEYPLTDAWSDVSPRLSVDYKVTPSVMLYVSFAKGFKSGSFNGRATGSSADVRPFEPEVVWSYEAGVKSQFFDNRVMLNLTGFYMDYKDIQITVNRTPDNFVANAAEARLQGMELEFRALPTANLSFDGSVGWLDAEYTEVGGSGLVLPITINSKLVRAPEWTANFGAQYVAELGDSGSLTFRLDAAYTSRQYYDAANAPLISQGSYTLWSGRIAYTSEDGSWTAALFGANLTDELYILSGNQASAAFGLLTEATYGRPREYGVSVSKRF